MSTRAKLEGLVDPVFLRLHNLFKDKNHSQRTRSIILLVLTSSLLLGIIGPLPVANAATKVVTFNANGGTGTMPNQNGSNSTPFVFSTNLYTFSGKTWDQWNTAVDGTGTNYLAGVSYTIANAVTVYAQWNSITFNANGGAGAIPTQAPVPAGTAFTVYAGGGITKIGFSLAGWTDGSNTYLPGAAYTVGANNIILTAVWSVAVARTVTYSLGGGTGTLPTQLPVVEGQTFKVATSAGLTKTGAAFIGWSNGTTTYLSGGAYKMGPANVILTAVWSK